MGFRETSFSARNEIPFSYYHLLFVSFCLYYQRHDSRCYYLGLHTCPSSVCNASDLQTTSITDSDDKGMLAVKSWIGSSVASH